MNINKYCNCKDIKDFSSYYKDIVITLKHRNKQNERSTYFIKFVLKKGKVEYCSYCDKKINKKIF